jgi:hypothetical protein
MTTTPLNAIIARHQAIRALIDQEDDEDQVAKLTQAEDRLLIKLARRRERNDAAFFGKVGYILASQTAEVGEPTMQDSFGVVAIALRRHLEQRPREA